ncbi:MAG: pyridoxamine 5'-phosphate oxidase family protein [Caldilineaceae bacterium]|nr:pyridoxamine 5'-phosphate oxidase family protein [Caldilineaceae bacterium]HRJ40587.1 pyridoxamine 5'-phosphate oxidase family protein [Caldilineaceae bacterium]
MLIPEKMREVLQKEGVVAIATSGDAGPHMANTWNSYIRITDDERLLIPAGRMNHTEANITKNSDVLLTLGSREVSGRNGLGTGFLIRGTAEFLASGPEFDAIKAIFKWARAALVVTVISATQTL